jgi:hypothetical protein
MACGGEVRPGLNCIVSPRETRAEKPHGRETTHKFG